MIYGVALRYSGRLLAVFAMVSAGTVLATPTTVSAASSEGCQAVSAGASVSSPLYQGQSFREIATSSCASRVQFERSPVGRNPTRQTATRWTKAAVPQPSGASWVQSTIGFKPGTYHYRVRMRVVGQLGMVDSPVLSFNILKPFATGNPARDYLGLANELNNACQVESAHCQTVAVTVTNQARAQQGLPPLTLPSNFWTLAYDQQSLIVVNEERISRHLAPFVGITSKLDGYALSGAVKDDDPLDPQSKYNYSGNWTDGLGNSVMDDFGYMYDDGWGGSKANTTNIDCSKARSSGCWGHREDILVNWSIPPTGSGPLSMGAVCLAQSNSFLGGWPDSCAQIFTNNTGSGPFTYTWAQAVADGA